MALRPASTTGLIAFGAFLYFAAFMAALAAFLLLFPGTSLDRLWALNPRAHTDLAALGKWVAVAFLFLSALAVYTAILWFHRRRRAWRIAVVILSVEVFGNIINFYRGDRLRGLVGFCIAFLLLAYLLSRRVRDAFP